MTADGDAKSKFPQFFGNRFGLPYPEFDLDFFHVL